LSPDPNPGPDRPVSESVAQATFSSGIAGSCTITNQVVAGDAMDPSKPPMLSLVSGKLDCTTNIPVKDNAVQYSLTAAVSTADGLSAPEIIEIVSHTATTPNISLPLCEDGASCLPADQSRSALFRGGLKITISSGDTRASAVFK
jgi:hypothetical protein